MRLRRYLPLAASLLLVLVVNDVPLGGAPQAVAATWVLFFLFRRFAAYLLIVVAFVQDTPNIGPQSSYILFAGCGALVVSQALARWRGASAVVAQIGSWRQYQQLVAMAAAVAAYGLLLSMIYHAIGEYDQFSLDRPYWILAAGMFMVLVFAMVVTRNIATDPLGSEKLLITAIVVIAHSLVIALLQIWLGEQWIRNPETFSTFGPSDDTLVPTALGIPRLNGTFISPNSLAASISLMSILVLVSRQSSTVSRTEIFWFVLLGILASIATFSKSNLLFYMFGVGFLVTRRASSLAMSAVGVVLAGIGLVMSGLAESLLESFRVLNLDDSLRTLVWEAAMERVETYKWLLGNGYSFWRQFFDTAVGYPLGEPHSFLLAIPGTFGAVGVAFYCWLLFVLSRTFIRTGSQRLKLLIVLLISHIYIRESVTEQSVLGHTVFSFWLWLTIGLVLVSTRSRTPWVQPTDRHLPAATNAIRSA